MLESGNAKKITFLLSQIRALSHRHLPMSNSFIPYDILLLIITHKVNGDSISVKSLFASLRHSDSGIRYHFDKLISMGWISLHPHHKDSRVKLCLINEEFEDLMSNYLLEIANITKQIQID